MKSFIRWPGLGVFASCVALICLLTFFFVDGFIERVVEDQGSEMVGARVDLGDANLSFFPMGLELSGLQVTNPDEPLNNIIEIDRIAFAMDTMKLLERKIIIDEMTVTGIRPDTPRKKSGAIAKYAGRKKAKTSKEAGKGISMPSLKIPDIKEVLAKEQLASLDLARKFQEDLQADKENWQQQLGVLPDKKKLASYRERINKLKSGSNLSGFLGMASELGSLRDEIQIDLDRLKNAQNSFDQVSSSYQKRLTELQEAPQKDIQRLADKYSLSTTGLANLTPMLFGEKAGGLVEKALAWYAKAQPLLERAKEKKGDKEIVKPARGKGVLVRFNEEEPLPDLLVRKIKASIVIEAGNIDGTIQNLTPDQDRLGIPLTFAFGGDSLKGLRSISFDGVFNHVDPGQSRDTFNLKISGYTLAKTELSGKDSLPVTINGGLMDLAGQAVLQGQAINGDIKAGLKSVNLTSSLNAKGDSTSQAIADVLDTITDFTANVGITGTVDDYKLQLSSDLDKILKKAVADTLKTQTARFKQDLQDGVMEKVKGPLAGANGNFADFGAISSELSDRLKLGGNLL